MITKDNGLWDVDGKKYISRSRSICQICTAEADGRFLWIKQILNSGNDIILECPYCDTITPVHSSSVVYDTKYGILNNVR